MNKYARSVIKGISAALCLAMLISVLLSCTPTDTAGLTDTESPDQESTVPSLEVVRDGEYLFTLVVSASQSHEYKIALKLLQERFEEQFGAAIPCVSTASDVPSENIIIFGDVGFEHPAVDAARARLVGDGFAAAFAEGAIALFADSDDLLYDLASLFAEKYVRADRYACLTVDTDLSLMRSFTPAFDTYEAEFDFSLPVISVDVAGDPYISKNKNYPCRVDISNCYTEQVLSNERATVKGRGNGSWIYSELKKSYKLEFEDKVNLLGVGSSLNRDWILLANPFDYTELRNAIAFTLGREVFTNIVYCTDFAHANVFVDGVYKGVYLVCDQAETGNDRIEVYEDPDNMAKSDYHIELDSYAASDGYIHGVDYFEIEGRKFLIKSDYNSTERCAFVKSRFEHMFEAIRSGDPGRIEFFIDMDSCVDMFLLQEYTKNTDVGWSSFNMVLRSGGRLEFTAPWDIDLSAGNDYRIDGGSPEGAHAEDDDYDGLYNPIFVELCKHDFFMKLVIDRWNEKKVDAKSAVLGYIDTQVLRYSDEFIYDIGLNYPAESVHKFSSAYEPSAVYHDNMKYMRSWYINRTSWLDEYYAHRLD